MSLCLNFGYIYCCDCLIYLLINKENEKLAWDIGLVVVEEMRLWKIFCEVMSIY